jgi:hypothetical protein
LEEEEILRTATSEMGGVRKPLALPVGFNFLPDRPAYFF